MLTMWLPNTRHLSKRLHPEESVASLDHPKGGESAFVDHRKKGEVRVTGQVGSPSHGEQEVLGP
jgi:hypothetical protein